MNPHCIKYCFAALLIACAAVYFPVSGLQFQLNWDDGWMVMNRYTENGFTWDNLRAISTETWYGQYSPVNQLFYTTIYYFFWQNSAVYHLNCLLLHFANACLVFLLIYRILSYAKRTDEKTSIIVSFFVAFLFCIHPLQVESVAWISASKVILYSFFSLLAFLAYLKYTHTDKLKYYALAFALFVLSCGSKEQAVALPASLILLDWAMKRSMKNADVWIEKLPFIIFAVFFGLFTMSMQSPALVQEWAGYTFLQRLPLACYALVEYTVKLALPVNLLHLYLFPMAPSEALPLRMLIYPALILVATIGLFTVRKNWIVIFGVCFFLINIALTVHIAPMSRYNIVADRYVYLPCIGLFFVGVWYIVSYLQSLTKKRRQWYYAIAVCYVLYLGIYAHQRTKVWYDNDSLKKELRELIDKNIQTETSENQQNQ